MKKKSFPALVMVDSDRAGELAMEMREVAREKLIKRQEEGTLDVGRLCAAVTKLVKDECGPQATYLEVTALVVHVLAQTELVTSRALLQNALPTSGMTHELMHDALRAAMEMMLHEDRDWVLEPSERSPKDKAPAVTFRTRGGSA